MTDIIYYLKKNTFIKRQSRERIDNILLVILFVFIIFITGCSGPVGSNTSSKMITGYDGLTLQFMEGNFEEVFADEPFAISYFISNSGTSDVTDARLTITSMGGINANTQENSDLSPIDLKGKSFEYPYPEEKYYEAFFTAKNNLNKLDYKKETISFNLCYAYATSFATTVCIDTRISTQDQRRPACSSKSVSGDSGQGAPIAVTNIVPEMLVAPNNNIRPQFKIYATNKGKGRAIYPKTDNSNPCQDSNYDFDTISIKAFLSDVELTCSPKKITLRSGDSYFRCYVSDEDIANFPSTTLNYIAPLRVELDYYYTESFKYSLTIKRAAAFSTTTNTLSEDDNCGPYMAKNNSGKCEDLCSFCLNNKEHEKCLKEGINYLSNAYSCSCSREKCLESNKKTHDSCLFGYCEGSKYCCKDENCAGKLNGEQCGDNYACVDEKCTDITQCDFFAKREGTQKTCMNSKLCDITTIETGYCPGGDENVCCVKNELDCKPPKISYHGGCLSLCDYCATDFGKKDSMWCRDLIKNQYFNLSFECLCDKNTCNSLAPNGLCFDEKTNNPPNYCASKINTGDTYCCIQPDKFCEGKSDGTPCDKNYVCKEGICQNNGNIKLDECGQHKIESNENYGCYVSEDFCKTGTIYEGVPNSYPGACSTDNLFCCIENTCRDKTNGSSCGTNNEYVCMDKQCSVLKPCESYSALCKFPDSCEPGYKLSAYCPDDKWCCLTNE